MAETEDAIDVRLGEGLSVVTGAVPDADAVFLSIDSVGSAGGLNRQILRELGLGEDSLPVASDLAGGYFIAPAGRRLLCYIVTIDGSAPAHLLKVNLDRCLNDPRLAAIHSLWVPLMGTGAAGLSLERSFQITLEVLKRGGWQSRPGITITIATPGPEAPGFGALVEAVHALAPASAIPQELADRWSPSLASQIVLSIAASLGRAGTMPGLLTTELLLFALADAARTDAFAKVGPDREVGAFGAAVDELAGERYLAGWKELFQHQWRPPEGVGLRRFSELTPNAAAVLDRAMTRGKGAGRAQFTVDDLVLSLLTGDGQYVGYLARMGTDPSALLDAYRDVLTGQILMSLHNDVASIQDHLGFSAYANAIASFLLNAKTPAPLSVSVQAPWGAGKSSLMQMVRERLDPAHVRDANRPRLGPRIEHSLKLGAVLNFLEKRQDIGPDFWRDDRALAQPGQEQQRDGLITIWFNAWKYESSEQVWAGLVDAIVSQIADRLPLAQREAFLLRLHLARIDDGIVRRKIHDRLLETVVAQFWRIGVWGASSVLALLGLGQAKQLLPELGLLSERLARLGQWGSMAGLVLLAITLMWRTWFARTRVNAEPASFSLAPYLTVPDYTQSVGAIHQIHADLRRVLSVAPKEGPDTYSPVVIFIDDLDRCQPTKIASVVEGISMLLASETYRCMFVIGMDPQVVAAALEKAHQDIRERLPSYERSVPLGWRFMDKFVQLPFTIPPHADLGDYLQSLGAEGSTAATETSEVGAESENRQAGKASARSGPSGRPPDRDVAASPRLVEMPGANDDSKDVGRIVRQLGRYSGGNPREIKRMVNLARLYLALRNERRRLDPFWRAPSLVQYARWIALTLRWPDMMRWLQWGIDEARWPADGDGTSLVVRRLRQLEAVAIEAADVDAWAAQVQVTLGLKADEAIEWRTDQRLFEFFRDCGRVVHPGRLSDAAATGLW